MDCLQTQRSRLVELKRNSDELSLAAQTLSPEAQQEADDLRSKIESLLAATQVRRRVWTYE